MNKLILTGTVAALALTALTASKPAAAQNVFTQKGSGSFKFFSFTSGTDKLNLLANGTYLGQTGLFSFTSSFTGKAASDGTYSSTDASTTFSFKKTGATTFSTIDSGVGNLYFDTSDPGLAFSDLKGYSFTASTINTSTKTLPFGTEETGSVTDAILTKSAPVPEAGTMVSFGALLALGGLAVLRRKTSASTAA